MTVWRIIESARENVARGRSGSDAQNKDRGKKAKRAGHYGGFMAEKKERHCAKLLVASALFPPRVRIYFFRGRGRVRYSG